MGGPSAMISDARLAILKLSRTDSKTLNRNSAFESSQTTGETLRELDGFEPLAPQYVRLEQRTSYIAALILCVIVMVGTAPLLAAALKNVWASLGILVSGLAIAGLFVLGSHFWPRIKYRHIHWRLSETGMEIRRGVFWQHRISVPMARVQHVDVSQGPVQRLFDLGTLTIHTAGTKNASVELEGLQYAEALQLRDRLIRQRESLDVT